MTFDTILSQETIDEYTEAGYFSNRTITDFLDDAAASTPDKTAAIDPRRQVTYRELQAETDRCALGLLELGVQPGDVVSFQLPNWIEFLVLHFAATRIGAVSNPLIPIYRDREVGFMVGFSRLQGPGDPAGVPQVRLPGHGRPAPADLARPAARVRGRRPTRRREPVLGIVHGHTVGATPRPGRAHHACARTRTT